MFSFAPKTFALFSAQAQITGITLQVGSFGPPELTLYINDDKTEAGFILENVAEYSQIEYTLRYKGKGSKWQAVVETIDNTQGDYQIEVDEIYLGTCSQGVCTPTERLHQVFLDVVLTNGKDVKLKDKLFASKTL